MKKLWLMVLFGLSARHVQGFLFFLDVEDVIHWCCIHLFGPMSGQILYVEQACYVGISTLILCSCLGELLYVYFLIWLHVLGTLTLWLVKQYIPCPSLFGLPIIV